MPRIVQQTPSKGKVKITKVTHGWSYRWWIEDHEDGNDNENCKNYDGDRDDDDDPEEEWWQWCLTGGEKTNGWTKGCGGDKAEKGDAEGYFCDGDEGGLDDPDKAQELDGHDHPQDGERGVLHDQDQYQCRPVDDHGQHTSGRVRSGLFWIFNFYSLYCAIKVKVGFFDFFAHCSWINLFVGGGLSDCWALRPGCLSWVEYLLLVFLGETSIRKKCVLSCIFQISCPPPPIQAT